MPKKSALIPLLAPLLAAAMSGAAMAQTTVTLLHVEEGKPLLEAWEKMAADLEAGLAVFFLQI